MQETSEDPFELVLPAVKHTTVRHPVCQLGPVLKVAETHRENLRSGACFGLAG